MKKILFSLVALCSLQVQAQDSQILEESFWQKKPDLSTIKAEVAKGFSFEDVEDMQDPIILAFRNESPCSTINYLLELPGSDISRRLHEGRNYLHVAAHAGKTQAVDCLINAGADIYSLDANGHTAFTYTGFQGKLTPNMIDVFIKHGIDLHKKYPTKFGADILLLSIPYDKELKITDYLISKGLSLDTTDDDGNTALNHAAKIGNVETMKELHQRGVNYTKYALILASQGTYRSANTIEVFKYLVEELNIDPKTEDQTGKNVLHSIASKSDQAEVVNYFLAKGVDVNKKDAEGNTPFLIAAGGQSFEVVEAMFAYVNKNTINYENPEGKTALLAAIESGAGKSVALLLENGADANVTDEKGNTLAYYLIESYKKPRGRGRGPSPEVLLKDFGIKVDALKKADVDLSAPQEGGKTIYHLAAGKNDSNLLKAIAGLNVDVNTQDDEGTTALHRAAMVAEDDSVLKYLLSIGADKHIETEFGETAYSIAAENEFLSKKKVSIDFLK